MINFRFHLVSLVAVFLALTVGIVMGATVIDRAIVDGLNDRIDAVSRKADTRKKESEVLKAEVGRLNEFIGQSQPYVVEGRLTNVPVVVLATRGISTDAVTKQVEVLRAAGAVVPAVLWLESSWILGDKTTTDKLGDALGETSRDPTTLRDAAWTALAARLHDGQATAEITPPSSPAVPYSDALTALIQAGFVQVDRLGGAQVDQAAFPGRDARAVLLSGAGFAPGNLLRSAARSLAGAGIPTVVGEVYAEAFTTSGRGQVLAPLRTGVAIAGVSTVDDVELPEGRMAVALAGSDLGQQPPVSGHYGYGDGATRALPLYKPS